MRDDKRTTKVFCLSGTAPANFLFFSQNISMKLLLSLLLLIFSIPAFADTTSYVLLIHGGAGSIRSGSLSPRAEAAYRNGLQAALDAGGAVLKRGGSALDAVTAAVQVLEDDSMFNAGRGAVFTHEGRNELDASIMDGRNLDAGAVAGITTIKNPVRAARAVMEHSPHVMLSGPGAERFAQSQGLEVVDPAYFFTYSRWRSLQQARRADSLRGITDSSRGMIRSAHPDFKFGTVGAVALDRNGHLAAATSTGGMTNKRWGRVGDSPIIGAGTYADDQSCAVSCTGHGEYFIRLVMAKSLSDYITLAGLSLQAAADTMIHHKLAGLGGAGGLIALDRKGNMAMPFNTSGMFRAWLRADGSSAILMYSDEPKR
jgi:beta-aspartyl-peptidase (threonine type)